MKLEFGYGNRTETVDVPDGNLEAVLVSNPAEHRRCGEDAVRWALEHPAGSPGLRELVRLKARKLAAAGGLNRQRPQVAVIISDVSRPVPSRDILPALLDELYAGGAEPDDITVVIARGSHRKSTDEEKLRLAGERCYNEVRVIDSSWDDCVDFGTTKAGTPVVIDRTAAEADMRICTGNIEFHYFAGYSGGCKALMPGCSTPAAIQANHSMMTDPGAHAGNLDGNPVREDLEEAAAMVGIDFIVNAVLDEHKHIVYAAAGDLREAHRDGCRYLDMMYRKTVSRPADIILVSQGGAPKDANLYQTQKALDNSKHIIKDGGTIILIGACSEGPGNETFERWLTEAGKPGDLTERIRRQFRLGGHKAAAIAMVMERAEVYLVSDMDPDFVRSIFFRPAASAQEAFDEALAKHGPDARVIAMPFGGAVLPSLS